MTHHVHCFDCAQDYEQLTEPKPTVCGACGSNRVGVLTEKVAPNRVARSGYDRCDCGCKYWENDTCIDCGFTLTSIEIRDRREAAQDAAA